jgi:sigma-B regulation protein RsbU (phosphoserine phosphatase)
MTSLILGMVISKDVGWLHGLGEEPAVLNAARRSVIAEVLFIMAVLLVLLVNLIISYSKNLKLLFANETRVLKKVSQGDLTTMVPVATQDEFGLIAGHTNHMIEGLRHRMKLVASLKLAEEVQQKLLPQNAPRLPGVDVAGTSIYCDETGGDYFDYFVLPGDRLVAVVADASDHGVGAALDMTTARAFIKYGIEHKTAPADLLMQVNQFLVRDSADTGRFTTLFLLEVDIPGQRLEWIRAGQDPALHYDPVGDCFDELDGHGLALGLDEDFRFEANGRDGWNGGTVLLLATDGLHETRNGEDQLFGRERIRGIIRDHAQGSAKDILKALVSAGESFRGQAPQEDDLTLVVIKLEKRPGAP